MIRSITINNLKNHKNYHYAMLLIFKKSRRPAGGLKIRTHADKWGGGKNGQKFADVLHGWPPEGYMVLLEI